MINALQSKIGKIVFLSCLISILSFSELKAATMSGTYSIDPSGSGNYKTFGAALSDLKANGVGGACVFKVADGTYQEQLDITSISGASSSNTITFVSASKDSTKVKLSYPSNSGQNYVVYLDGADYIQFSKITISRTGNGTSAVVVAIRGGASYNTISGCILLGVKQTTYNTNATIVYSPADNDSGNTFKNNIIRNGFAGFYMYGSGSTTPERYNVIKENQIDSFYYYGIFGYYIGNSIIDGNRIENGVYMYTFGMMYYYPTSLSVTANYINSAYMGLYMYYGTGLSTSPNLIANNMIVSRGQGNNYVYGYYMYNNSYLMILNNSYLMSGNPSGGYGMYNNPNSHCTIENNSFFVNTTASNTYATVNYNTSNIDSADNNNYFTKGTTLAIWNGTTCSNLSALQSNSSMESNSISVNPLYYSKTDLHAQNPALDAAANPLSNVKTDFDRQIRNTKTPDIGADEFNVASLDAGIFSIDSPAVGFCGGKQAVYVTIMNFGSSTLTSADINWKVNGTTQTSVSWTGSLKPGEMESVNIGNYTISSGTSYNFYSWTTKPNGGKDGNNSNDTASYLNMQTGMTGTYTIGGSSPDYATFNDALKALNSHGICGAVTLNVRDGSYNEQLEINEIAGASSTNTVTFQSQSGNNSKVVLWANTQGPKNYIWGLQGADYITLKDITVSNKMGNLVSIGGMACNNTIEGCKLISTTSTSYYPYVIYDATYENDSANSFIDNHIIGGYIGMYLYGNTETNTLVKNNTLDSIRYAGMFAYYQSKFIVTGNTINTYTTGGIGIYSYYNYDWFLIEKNNVNMMQGGMGIYSYYSNTSSSSPGLITNNFISVDASSTTGYGIYMYYDDYVYALNNSINIYGSSGNGSYGIYAGYYQSNSYTGILLNNCIINKAGGYALYEDYSIGRSNYNNLVTNGTYVANWDGTDYTDISSLTSGAYVDSNSQALNPWYKSKKDLHVGNPKMNDLGTPVSFVADDMDGQTRSSSTPDIGADEFTPPSNDAGVLSIDSPASGFCPGKKDVYVSIFNYGLNTLTSATINWKVNGTTQTKYNWTGSLKSGEYDSMIKIGSYTFAANTNYTVISYTTLPNGATDGNNANDTFSFGNKSGLSGTYTIGGSSPDYTTFTDAINDLAQRGVCGGVIFNVRSGTYTEQITIPDIPGTSATSTVTFQSQALDSTKVLLTNGGATTYNYVVGMNGCDWVTIKNMTIMSNNVYVISFDNGSHRNTIWGNRLIGSKTAYNYIIMSSSGVNDTFNTIKYNSFKYSYFALYLYGYNSTGYYESDWKILNNSFDSTNYYSIYVYYQNNLTIKGNTIRNTINSNIYAAFNGYCGGTYEFSHNNINMPNSGYGLYFYGSGGNLNGHISNNFISINNNGSTANGLYIYYGDSIGIYNNNINIYGTTNTNSNAYYQGNTSNSNVIDVYNNCFANFVGGYAINCPTSSATNVSDNNNFYSNGSNLGIWGGTAYSSLSAWQSASSQDANSVSVDPIYYNNKDLHVNAKALDSAGKVISFITDDIDKQKRNSTKPDIGADEFVAASYDAGVAGIDSPYVGCAGKKPVYAALKNYGSTTLTSVDIHWTINGTAQTTISWTGSLKQGAIDLVKLGTYTFASGTSYDLVSWTVKPNGNTDANNTNDTAKKTFADALSGTYTIGGSSPDFPNFTAAVNALVNRGVCGAVTFNVRNGFYREQLTIPQILGASAINTITFQSQNGSSGYVTLWMPTNTSFPNAIISLSGASYFTFKNLNVKAVDTGGTNYYGVPFYITKGASYNTITSCTVSTNGMYSYAFYMYSYQGACDFNTISNCNIRAGYYGVYAYGYTGTNVYQRALQIKNNNLDSFNYYSIMCYYQDSAQITGNNISQQGYTTGYGIYALYNRSGMNISKNNIKIVNGNYGIMIYYSGFVPASPGRIFNNFITVGGSTAYGLYIYSSDNLNIYYNSVRLVGSSGTNYSAYINNYYNAQNTINFKNNNLVNNASGYCLYVNNATSLATCDYNNFYFNGSNMAYFNGSSYSSLSNWQSGTGFDAKSRNLDPQFPATTDLHVKNKNLNNTGTPISGITDDFDGDTRNPSTPDIGADEFSPAADDMEATAVLTPSANECGDSNVYIKAVFTNVGSNNQTKVPVYAALSGLVSTTFYDTLASVSAGKSDTITFKTKINTYAGGTLNIKLYVGLAKDVDRSNDTINYKSSIQAKASNVVAYGANRCSAGVVKLYGTHAKGEELNWYTASSGGTSFYTGDTFTTSYLTSSVTYYVEANWPFPALPCPGKRVAVSAIIGTASANISVNTSQFIGKINNGTSGNPDVVCAGTGVASYSLVTGYSNAAYNSTWYISNWSIKTAKGTAASNVSMTNPSSSGNGTFTYTSSSSEADSTFILTITVHDKTQGCDSTVKRYIYNSPNPVAKFGTSIACAGYAVQFTDSSKAGSGSLSYYYEFGDGGTSTSASPSHTYASSGSYTVKLTVTNTAGCTNSTTRSANVYASPKAKFGATPSGCAGKVITFYDSSTAGSGTINSWYYIFSDGGSASYQNPTHTFTSAGTYFIKMVVTNTNGCKDSTTRSISILNSPSVGFTASVVCLGDSTRFNNLTSAASTYSWDFGDGNTSSLRSPAHLYGTAGTYKVKLTAANPTGCSDTFSKSIVVYDIPGAAFTQSASSGCTGDVITFTDNSTGNGLSYSWNFGDGTTASTTQSPTHTFTKAGTFHVVLSVKNAGGCSDTIGNFVTINETPKAAFGFNNACLKAPVQFTDSSSISSGTLTYAWDFGDGGTSTAQSPTHAFQTASSFNVSLTVKSSSGCTNKITKVVKPNLLPNVTFTPTVVKRDVTFTPSDLTMSSYSWDFGDTTTSTAVSPVHSYKYNSTFTVSLTVTNAQGCSKTFTSTVTINVVGIGESKENKFALNIMPNPFTESTTITFVNPKTQTLKVSLVDVTGKELMVLANGMHTSATYAYTLTASEAKLTAGMYFLKLSTGDGSVTRQIIRLK